MDSQLDVTVFKDNALSELKPEFELKKDQMTTHPQEIRSKEIKKESGVDAEISYKDSTYFPYKTDYLESFLLVKQDFTIDQDLQVTQNLYRSEAKCLETDATEMKQEYPHNDTDTKSNQICNCELKKFEHINDKKFNELQFKIETKVK